MISTIIIAALASLSATYAAPAFTAAAIQGNGRAAQQLNVGFQNLTINDACQTGEVACVAGTVAECDNNAWTLTQNCAPNQCFALPSRRQNGTFLSCSTEEDALDMFEAAQVFGGIFGTDDTGDECADDDEDDGDVCDDEVGDDQDQGASDSDNGVLTVTVTVTPSAAATSTTESTTTLSPEEASIFLSSLSATAFSSAGTEAANSATSASATASEIVAGSAITTTSAAAPTATTSDSLVTASTGIIELTIGRRAPLASSIA